MLKKASPQFQGTVTNGLHAQLTNEINSLVGETVICVFPDGRLSVGLLEEVTKVGTFSIPLPIVHDYFTANRIACLGKVYQCDQELLQALATMTSRQRCLVVFSSPSILMRMPHPSSDNYSGAEFAEALRLGKDYVHFTRP